MTIDEALKQSLASLEIEGKTLTQEQLELIRKSLNGEISQEEFLNSALKISLKS